MPTNVQNLHPADSLAEFGRVVGDARRHRKLTQEQAADLLGMSRRKLLDIEAGRIELARYERAGILDVLVGTPRELEAGTVKHEHGTGTPVMLCGVWMDLISGDDLAWTFHRAAKVLKARGGDRWPPHMCALRTIVCQFEEYRPRLARMKSP